MQRPLPLSKDPFLYAKTPSSNLQAKTPSGHRPLSPLNTMYFSPTKKAQGRGEGGGAGGRREGRLGANESRGRAVSITGHSTGSRR